MKTSVTILLFTSLLFLTGCDEKAQEYAKQLNDVLKSYQTQVIKKNNAEQEAYKSLTAFYAHAEDEDLFFRLELARNERVRALADDYVSGKKPAPTNTDLRALLKDYGTFDFEQTKGSLENESEASIRFLANLEKLELETAKIESLSKLLEQLSKPKQPLTQLKDFVNFAGQVDKEFQKLACDDLAREIKCLEKQAANEKDTAKKDRLDAEIGRLKEQLSRQKSEGKCSANVDTITCPN